jgi:antitoxin (DNA-binding transcriptional repressor) of toxin-antitoxin stability system
LKRRGANPKRVSAKTPLRHLADRRSASITKKGKPVAKVVLHKPAKRPDLFGLCKGRLKIIGDIISPIDVEWECDERNLWSLPKPK